MDIIKVKNKIVVIYGFLRQIYINKSYGSRRVQTQKSGSKCKTLKRGHPITCEWPITCGHPITCRLPIDGRWNAFEWCITCLFLFIVLEGKHSVGFVSDGG